MRELGTPVILTPGAVSRAPRLGLLRRSWPLPRLPRLGSRMAVFSVYIYIYIYEKRHRLDGENHEKCDSTMVLAYFSSKCGTVQLFLIVLGVGFWWFPPGAFWAPLGPLGTLLGSLGTSGLFGPPWDPLGTLLGPSGHLWDPLGPSWAGLV